MIILEDFYTRHKTPGPWTYNIPYSINSTGKFPSSNCKCSSGIPFNPPRSNRFFSISIVNVELSNKPNPGPGQYEVKIKMSNNGKYLLSNIPAFHAQPFSNSLRTTDKTFKIPTPGPGSYNERSEFGYYREFKTPNSIRSRNLTKNNTVS